MLTLKLLLKLVAVAMPVLFANQVSVAQIRPPAEQLGNDPFKAMEEFSRCSVRFEIASAVATDAEQPATAEEYAGTARGAKAVATFYAMYLASEAAEKGSQEFPEALNHRQQQIDSFIELEWVNQAAFVERGEMDEAGFQYCFNIQALQIAVIEQMRREGLL
ncbi:MAG: hypothetical protein NXH72_08945 [Hyphomonadaceae bacterium]|nr:hypothetical protein [Hyphomonadaceae bacterium]